MWTRGERERDDGSGEQQLRDRRVHRANSQRLGADQSQLQGRLTFLTESEKREFFGESTVWREREAGGRQASGGGGGRGGDDDAWWPQKPLETTETEKRQQERPPAQERPQVQAAQEKQ